VSERVDEHVNDTMTNGTGYRGRARGNRAILIGNSVIRNLRNLPGMSGLQFYNRRRIGSNGICNPRSFPAPAAALVGNAR
jgi:hypothetical protein